MTIIEAVRVAQQGQKIRLASWPPKDYVTHTNYGTLRKTEWETDGSPRTKIFHWLCGPEEILSEDWEVIEP